MVVVVVLIVVAVYYLNVKIVRAGANRNNLLQFIYTVVYFLPALIGFFKPYELMALYSLSH